jgi:type II secretory pathway predicted ATPase ExeA
MYQQYWGFRQPPFNLGHDGQGYFKSPAQVEALARLTFLVNDQHRLGLLVGPSGIGKSVLLDAFGRRQRMRGHQVARINLLGMQYDEFIWHLAGELGETPRQSDTLGELWRRIQDRLLVNRYQQVTTVMLFDDADEAEQDVLTAITRLAIWPPAAEAQITIVVTCDDCRIELVGRRLLELSELRIELGAWEHYDTAEFLNQILANAGREAPVFDADAIEKIHEISAGIPRRICQVGAMSLVAGAGYGLETIDAETIVDVVSELSVSGSTLAAF